MAPESSDSLKGDSRGLSRALLWKVQYYFATKIFEMALFYELITLSENLSYDKEHTRWLYSKVRRSYGKKRAIEIYLVPPQKLRAMLEIIAEYWPKNKMNSHPP